MRALVRDPAVSEGREGRIKPGDKIVAVSVSFSQPSVGFVCVCPNLGLLIERKTFLVWEKIPIKQVNDVPLCPMTHEEAVLFLRQAKDRVKLRLFRDISQTPIASISPSSSEQFIPNAGKPKASLRYGIITIDTQRVLFSFVLFSSFHFDTLAT